MGGGELDGGEERNSDGDGSVDGRGGARYSDLGYCECAMMWGGSMQH